MFPINPAVLPSLRTRQALLVLDLQNDFILPDGALPVQGSPDFVSRTIEVAKAFRDSGAGDVIWVRTEFDCHRPLSLEGDQIITTDAPQIHKRTTAAPRGRQPTSGRLELEYKEADEEAFLSAPPGSDKPACVRPDTPGSRLAAEIEEAVDAARDFAFTKTHYSAFASGPQLLQLLRGRFVTELYICGALTNISVYATALDAGQHGYQITIVEDCCGYRSEMRHGSAMSQLLTLTGCEVMNSDDVVNKIRPGKPESDAGGSGVSPEQDRRGKAGSRCGGGESAGGRRKSPVRPLAPADDPSGLHLSMRNLTLSGASSSAARPSTQPQAKTATHAQPLQPVVKATLASALSDTAGGADDSQKRMVDDRNAQRKFSNTNLKGPPSVPNPARGTNSTKPSITSNSGAVSATPQRVDPCRQSTSQESTMSPKREGPRASRDRVSPAMDNRRTAPAPLTSEPLCEGDTSIVENVLPPDLASSAFERLEAEVEWLRMSHQGGEVPRLVAVQGAVDDEGNMPVYRHPADESPPLLPFSATVLEIKAATEKHLGHPLNHVLIQFYRDGTDYISEHSDKTLDIVPGSFIANVSLGAERTMVFRTKRLDKDPSRNHGNTTPDPSLAATAGDNTTISPAAASPASTTTTTPPPPPNDPHKRRVQRANLPHNSLCRMGLTTNKRWLHAIRQDKRLDRHKTAAELAFKGQRISLTFRQIGTYLNASQTLIWGQGATSKSPPPSARPVLNGQRPEAVSMIRAFGTENHSAEFDWERHYGVGFDVLHMTASPRLFAGPDAVVNARVALALAGMGVAHAGGSTGAAANRPEAVRFVDNDDAKSVVEGGLAVLLYLDVVYGGGDEDEGKPSAPARPEIARRMTRLQQGVTLLEQWRAAQRESEGGGGGGGAKRALLKTVRRELAAWDGYAGEARDAAAAGSGADPRPVAYMAGGARPSIADFAVWPVLHDMVRVCGRDCLQGYENLAGYYRMMRKSEAVVKVFGDEEKEEDDNDGEAARSAVATPTK